MFYELLPTNLAKYISQHMSIKIISWTKINQIVYEYIQWIYSFFLNKLSFLTTIRKLCLFYALIYEFSLYCKH